MNGSGKSGRFAIADVYLEGRVVSASSAPVKRVAACREFAGESPHRKSAGRSSIETQRASPSNAQLLAQRDQRKVYFAVMPCGAVDHLRSALVSVKPCLQMALSPGQPDSQRRRGNANLLPITQNLR